VNNEREYAILVCCLACDCLIDGGEGGPMGQPNRFFSLLTLVRVEEMAGGILFLVEVVAL